MSEVDFINEEGAPEDAHEDPIETKSKSESIQQNNVVSRAHIYDSTIEGPTINAGSDNKRFKFEQDKGMWLGHANFSSAPFSVDMDGNVNLTDAALTLDGIADGSTYKRVTSDEKTGAGRAYNGLSSSYKITKGFVESDLDSEPDPSDGVKIDSSGIYGYSGGSASFYINSSGDAYFEGDIGASTVDASLLVYNENYIKFFSDDGSFAQGFIYGDGNDELRISTVESGSNINIIADENYKINFEEWDSGLGNAYTRATIDSNGLEVSGSLSDGSTSRDVTNIVESEKVVIGTSSPDDTSALWIDTS